jgi:hypothetical protein
MKWFVTTKRLGLMFWLVAGLGGGVVFGQNTVKINEVLARNVTIRELSGSAPDWVEFYNSGASAVNLAGMSITTVTNNIRAFVFPEGTSIPSQGYTILYFDDQTPASGWNTGFGLNGGGDAVYFYDRSGVLVDSVVFGMQLDDKSIGRIPSGGTTWALCTPTRQSANAEAKIGTATALKINEWMADPASGADWFELYNPQVDPVAIGGLYLTDDLTKPTQSRIPSLSFLGTGSAAFQKFVADGTPAQGANHVSFKLSKNGSYLALYSGAGMIDGLHFGIQALGVSQGRVPDGGAYPVSFPKSSTPGSSNYLPLENVLINEVLTHTDPPLEDAIELYNPTTQDILIGGWFLSDSPANWKKFRIPDGTLLPAKGYAVFYENQFGNTNLATAFQLNSSEGDSVYLSSADAAGNLYGYRGEAHLGPAFNGVSFGRLATSMTVDYVPLTRRTFGQDNPATAEQFRTGKGASNAPPIIGPLVINEVMYDPAPLAGTSTDNTLDEYIELMNIASTNVPLYNVQEPTNTWRIRAAVDFNFSQNVSLPPGGYLLVVGFDPATDAKQLSSFRTRFNVSEGTPIYGPYTGKLSNNGESIKLEAPDLMQGILHNNTGLVPYVTVDKIEYLDGSPWPTSAKASGYSLQRKDAFLYGNEPTNWVAALPSAGRRNNGAKVDHDGDSLPDDWELLYGLDPFNPADAALDSDGDGFSNYQEFLIGTNPRDPQSAYKIDSAGLDSGNVWLQFNSVPGKGCSVLYLDTLSQTSWNVLTNFPPTGAKAKIDVYDPILKANQTRFYRLRLE